MASAARAERRRAARAAAKQPARGDEPWRVFQRGARDCMRAAVASVMQIEYELTPEYGGRQQLDVWRSWCAEHDLAMAQYLNVAPACSVWIAVLLLPQQHAVVVKDGALFHDPDPVSIREPLVEPVASAATVIGPRDFVQYTSERTRELLEAGGPAVWQLPAPLDPALRAMCPPAPAPPFVVEIPN
jgi:hypothetical protein